MLVDETPDMDDLMEETEKQTVQTILDLLHESDGTNEGQTYDESPSLLCSVNLIVSAMNGEIEQNYITSSVYHYVDQFCFNNFFDNDVT